MAQATHQGVLVLKCIVKIHDKWMLHLHAEYSHMMHCLSLNIITLTFDRTARSAFVCSIFSFSITIFFITTCINRSHTAARTHLCVVYTFIAYSLPEVLFRTCSTCHSTISSRGCQPYRVGATSLRVEWFDMGEESPWQSCLHR